MMEDLYEQAIAEAYASAPTDEVILHTMELRHPQFLDETGAIVPIRVVRDHEDWNLKLEGDAPTQANATVLFQACMFNFKMGEMSEGKMPEIEISIDNVTHLVSKNLDNAAKSGQVIELTYREYLASDTTMPQYILSGLTIRRARATVFRVTAVAQYFDLTNAAFPTKVYNLYDFPGLVNAT